MARKTIKQMREEEEIISQVSKKRKSKAMIKSIIQKYRN
jgi:hypothetical protein